MALLRGSAWFGVFVFVADEAPDNDDVRRIMVRAGRRVMSKLHRFFNDDERRREIDRSLESLNAASATPHPEISLIFAHGVGSLKELWDVYLDPHPPGNPSGPGAAWFPLTPLVRRFAPSCWTWSVFNDHSG